MKIDKINLPKSGDRIKCILMLDDNDPIEPDAEGTVISTDRLNHIYVKWDNGRNLSLIHGVDKYSIIEKVNESKIKSFKDYLNI